MARLKIEPQPENQVQVKRVRKEDTEGESVGGWVGGSTDIAGKDSGSIVCVHWASRFFGLDHVDVGVRL